MNRVYADHASTTRPAPEVVAAMLPWLGEAFGNASSVHTRGETARDAIEADTNRRAGPPYATLTPDEIGRLHRALVSVLQESIDARGTSFRDYRDATGQRGRS